MINCKHIRKSYEAQVVLEDFSYLFGDTGLYILFGESGSGKTTLLNILSGHIGFDGGAVLLDGTEYAKQVDEGEAKRNIGYITQDANFIEYLNIYDNLSLCCEDLSKIDSLLTEFGLDEKKELMPNQLSGGERQRISIIRELLCEKKIILLDEPTASLDYENKLTVFELLKKLKNSTLLICSSHDEIAKEYGDECIDFNRLSDYNRTHDIKEKKEKFCKDKQDLSKKRERLDSRYIRKWFTSPKKNKGSRISFCIIMLLAIMALCMSGSSQSKMYSSMEYIYGLNQLEVEVRKGHFDYIDALKEHENILEITMDYSGTVPLEKDGVPGTYNKRAWVLPQKEEAFKLDFLQCGRYIQNENEIIISDAMAMTMGKPEEQLGKSLKVKLYDGEYNMTIVGVFKEVNETENQYLYASGMYTYDDKTMYDDCFAISGSITERYTGDENFYSEINKVRQYIIYFDSYSSMMEFYKEVEGVDIEGVMYTPPMVEPGMESVYDTLCKYMYPIAGLVIIVALLFYYQTQKTELMYNKKIFVVYRYLGYSLKRIKNIWALYASLETTILFTVSFVTSLVLMNGINIVNRNIQIIPLEIFTYNIKLIVCVYLLVIVIGAINSWHMVKIINSKNIGESLVEQRDLL